MVQPFRLSGKVMDAPQRVPYRANRAVVFNSSLFHATDRFRFGSGIDQRRINITMLFGERRT